MPATPTSEPNTITAGESIAWLRTVSDYPATTVGNVLKYALQASGKPLITLTATASGADYLVSVDPATSANYAPGCYIWTAYIEQTGGAREIINRGQMTILPSPLAALTQTHAAKTLALIEAAIEGRIPNGLETTNIDGQELQRIHALDLFKLKVQYQQIVSSEQNKAQIAAGLGNRRNSFARFTRVS